MLLSSGVNPLTFLSHSRIFSLEPSFPNGAGCLCPPICEADEQKGLLSVPMSLFESTCQCDAIFHTQTSEIDPYHMHSDLSLLLTCSQLPAGYKVNNSILVFQVCLPSFLASTSFVANPTVNHNIVPFHLQCRVSPRLGHPIPIPMPVHSKQEHGIYTGIHGGGDSRHLSNDHESPTSRFDGACSRAQHNTASCR